MKDLCHFCPQSLSSRTRLEQTIPLWKKQKTVCMYFWNDEIKYWISNFCNIFSRRIKNKNTKFNKLSHQNAICTQNLANTIRCILLKEKKNRISVDRWRNNLKEYVIQQLIKFVKNVLEIISRNRLIVVHGAKVCSATLK